MPEATPRTEQWNAQLDACRKRRERLVKGVWQTNVSFRIQRPFTPSSDEDADVTGSDQIAVPADWSRTRSKTAALFSKMPRVSLVATQPAYMQAVPIFEQIVNHFAPLSGLKATMEECGADVVNAAGLCAAMMKYEATFEEVMVPATDPSLQPQLPPAPPMPQLPAPPGMQPQMQQQPQAGPMNGAIAEPPVSPLAGAPPALAMPDQAMAPLMGAPNLELPPPPMIPVQRVVSERYRAYRISPSQLLWPVEFNGSDWQRCRWLGYDGVMPWARAMDEFKLTEDDKPDCCCEAGATSTTITLSGDLNREVEKGGESVRFSEIFYWACLFDPEEKRYEAIRRIVFVKGKDEPVIDEPYSGQQWVPETRSFVGCSRLPIEVTTLTYVSDKAITPSDSEIGRPQVLEQIRSRSQMIMQRTRNLPIRSFDVNRVDPQVQDLLMRGTWQGMIPTNGPGDRVLSQIAAAAFPREDFTFDQVSNRDLDDAWSMSPNQMGTFNGGERSASEANFVASAYASVIGYQRDKIVSMFLGLVDTLMGLLQLNLDDYEAQPIVGPNGVKRLETWDRSKIAGKFVATTRQDESVLQDSGMRVNQLMKFLNIAGKSGRINIDPILTELAALSGLDPTQVLLPPQQPKPEPLNISYRLSGVADLLNPTAVALLIKAGQAPGPQEMEQAKQLILDSIAPPKQPPAQPPVGPMPWQIQALGASSTPSPEWEAMPRVTKRPEELGG
jgi:hypothetical protein